MVSRPSRGNWRPHPKRLRRSAVILVICIASFGAVAVPVIASTSRRDPARTGPRARVTRAHRHPPPTISRLAPPRQTRAHHTNDPHPADRHATRRRPRRSHRARPLTAVLAGSGVRVPRSYFGLSVEYWDIPLLARHPDTLVRLLRLLTVSDDGPLVLRIGGDSADHTLWEAAPHAGDPLAYELSPRWFRELRGMTAGAGLRLLLDLNLAARAPAMAAALAHEAERTLPRHSITAFEVGNEPDIYHREGSYRFATTADIRPATPATWDHYSAGRYAAAFRHYAGAIAGDRGGAARIPLAGPEVANPEHDLRYVQTLIDSDRSELALVTAHRYPYSACARPSSRGWPTIARILSPAASTGLARTVEPVVRLAASAELSVRVTEVDSVTCGGVPGISNTFATALWAPDALFSLLADGVAGVNVHVRQGTFNEAFEMTRRGLEARPLLYGLLAFVRTLSSGRTVLSGVVSAPRRDNIRVWGVRTTGGYLHVLVLDKGGRTVHLELRLPTADAAVVERLTAPRVRSTAGVTLAGQQLDAAGRWVGPLVTQRLVPGRDGYDLVLPAHSAALLNVKA
jgi:hypothetical protein